MTRPLQVYLDDEDLDRLESWARDRGWSKSQAVRVAIRALTRVAPADSLIELSGDIDGLPEDIGANFDRYVNEVFVARPLVPSRARRGRSRSALRR